MKYLSTIFTFLLIVLISACGEKEQAASQEYTSSSIPELLERQAAIGPAEEEEKILNTYDRLTQKIQDNPQNLKARLTMAELFMQEARITGEHGHYFPAALQLIERVLETGPEKAVKYRALLDKASVLLSLHQFKEAKQVGEAALKLNPYDSGIYGVLVDAHVELGDYEKAVEMADQMVAIRPDLRSYSRVSYLREIHGQVQGAIDAMKLAVSAGYPGAEHTEWARLNLGNLYKTYGYLDSAALEYNKSLSARPDYPFAIAALAEVKALQGDHRSADSLLQTAARLIPEVGFYVDMAKAAKEKGDTQRTQQLTKEILAMLADDEAAGHKMGLEYAAVHLELMDDTEGALRYAMEEHKVRPNNLDVNALLASIYNKKGEYIKAQQHLQQALRTGSRDPELRALESALMAEL